MISCDYTFDGTFHDDQYTSLLISLHITPFDNHTLDLTFFTNVPLP